MTQRKNQWLQQAFQIKGSVFLAIYQRVAWVGVFAFIISLLYYLKIPVSEPIFGGVVPSIVLGLLLVFRTNTAYERYWEGRKLWGSIVNDSRNLAWQIWVIIGEVEPEDRANKIAAMRLVEAFSVACKLSLKSEPVNRELAELISESQYLQLQKSKIPALQIVSWIGDYLQQQYKRGNDILHYSHVVLMQTILKNMIDCLGGCERILRTPLPLAYTIHLKQLLLIYCLLLPFQIVHELGWGTSPIVALISFTLFGIEEIGLEIENPFGDDPNDLPLDAICTTIKRNIEDFIQDNSFNSNHQD
jgi:putative membrane protein